MKQLIGFTAAIGVLVVSLFFPLAQAIYLQSSISLTSFGTIAHAEGEIYWKADFEEGTFYDVLDGGLGGYGSVDHQPDAGSEVTIVTDSFKGNYAAKCNVWDAGAGEMWSNRAELSRWKPHRDLEEAYYGVALKLGPNFHPPDTWSVITQLRTMDTQTDDRLLMEVHWNTGELMFVYWFPDPEYNRPWQDNVPVPIGEWFTVVIYARFTENGNYKLWVNEELVLNVDGDFRFRGDRVGPNFKAGVYVHTSSTQDKYVIVDEMTSASTYELALPQRE